MTSPWSRRAGVPQVSQGSQPVPGLAPDRRGRGGSWKGVGTLGIPLCLLSRLFCTPGLVCKSSWPAATRGYVQGPFLGLNLPGSSGCVCACVLEPFHGVSQCISQNDYQAVALRDPLSQHTLWPNKPPVESFFLPTDFWLLSNVSLLCSCLWRRALALGSSPQAFPTVAAQGFNAPRAGLHAKRGLCCRHRAVNLRAIA